MGSGVANPGGRPIETPDKPVLEPDKVEEQKQITQDPTILADRQAAVGAEQSQARAQAPEDGVTQNLLSKNRKARQLSASRAGSLLR